MSASKVQRASFASIQMHVLDSIKHVQFNLPAHRLITAPIHHANNATQQSHVLQEASIVHQHAMAFPNLIAMEIVHGVTPHGCA